MIVSKIQFVLPVEWRMKKIKYIHLMVLLLNSMKIVADPTITLFFKSDPDIETIAQKLKTPGKVAKYTLNGMGRAPLVQGIVGTYGGYIASSNYNGEMIFPRKHQRSLVHVLITSQIVPVPLFENTILQWQRVPGVPAVLYICEQKRDDKAGTYSWHTQEIPLAEDMNIPLSAIVIVAKPKNIIMNAGIVSTHESANLVLPDLFVKKGINIVENSTYILTLRHLFKPVVTEENREPLKILTHVLD